MNFFPIFLNAQDIRGEIQDIGKNQNSLNSGVSLSANPFLVNSLDEIDQVEDFSIQDTWGGYISHPKSLSLRFKLLASSGLVLKNMDTKRFSFYLQLVSTKKNVKKEIPVLHRTQWRNHFYQSRLSTPPLPREGAYRLIFKVKKNNGEIFSFKSTQTVEFSKRKINMIFVIDHSGSMEENDPKNSRFRSIKKIIYDPKLRQRISKVGVVRFSDGAQIDIPLTSIDRLDKEKLTALSALRPKGKTDFSKAFQKTMELYQSSRNKTVMVFLTDGESSYPYQEEHRQLAQRGISIFTVGLNHNQNGQSDGSGPQKNYNADLLKKIARESNGSFSETQDQTVSSVYRKIIEKSVGRQEKVMIYPMKSVYLENELIVIRYFDLERSREDEAWKLGKKFQARTRLKFLEVEVANPSEAEEGEILYHDRKGKRGNEGEVIFSHFKNWNEVKNHPQKLILRFFRRTKNESKKKTVREFVLFYRLSDDLPVLAPTKPLVFQNISINQYQVRYFNLVTTQEKINYVDLNYLEIISSTKNYNENTVKSKSRIVKSDQLGFLETPFSISKSTPRKQAVAFHLQRNLLKDISISNSLALSESDTFIGEGYLVVESAWGYFLNNLTYMVKPALTKKKFQKTFAESNTGSTQMNRQLIILIIATGLFFVNLFYWVYLLNKTHKSHSKLTKPPTKL